MTDYTVRRAISTDIPMLVGMDHDYSTDHVWQMAVSSAPDEVGVVFREVRLPRAMRVRYPRDPQRLMDSWSRQGAVWIAEREESRLGYCCLNPGPAEAGLWITDLVVDPAYRRQGVATRLVGAAQADAREQGLERLVLEMQSKNHPGTRLARKLGFAFAGYSDRYYRDQDIALFFVLELR
jgi:ribosomal protein S18 acetylase RimI-like enzyme